MQRATQKEEKPKKEEELKSTGNFVSPGTLIKQRWYWCLSFFVAFDIPQEKKSNFHISGRHVVIMEGDPHPGAVRGRMSFLNFNPSIDKLNEDSVCDQSEASTTFSGAQNVRPSERKDSSLKNGSGITEMGMHSGITDGELKRKQAEAATEVLHPNKLKKNGNGDPEPSSGRKMNSNKQSKREKLDWNVLRPAKGQSKKG
ncbi:hypothetical protein V2J09_000864 [Rumex salicifolius]